jgi:hypothetical protein
MAKTLACQLSSCEVEITTGNYKSYESLGTGNISAEFIEELGKMLCSLIHRLINSISNEE